MSQPSGGGSSPPAAPPVPRAGCAPARSPQRALPSGSLPSRWVARWVWDSASERARLSGSRSASATRPLPKALEFGPLSVSDKLGFFSGIEISQLGIRA